MLLKLSEVWESLLYVGCRFDFICISRTFENDCKCDVACFTAVRCFIFGNYKLLCNIIGHEWRVILTYFLINEDN